MHGVAELLRSVPRVHRRPDGKHTAAGRKSPAHARGTPPLETIIETAHEAFVSIDEEGRILAWNREAERTFGWAKELVLGERVRDVLIPPRYREQHDRGMRQFLETGEGPLLNKRIEIGALHRSGREIPVEVTISALEDRGRWSFHAFLHDISERYRANELQARLATLVEHSADAIVSRTPEGVITSWNPGAERMYGYNAEAMLGRTVDVLVPPDREPEAHELITRALGGESVKAFETERLTKDGRRIDVSITVSPIYDDAGRVSELAMFVRDITTSKEAQRALVRAYEELRRTNELKSELVAIASHELRTPLTSIVGFAATLAARWHELGEQDRVEFLGLIESQGKRLSRLVDDVLLLSRIEAGRVAGAHGPVDLTEVARQVVLELRAGPETQLAVEGEPLALADRAHVHQILLNFLANAVAYGEPPFTVAVEEGAATVTARVCDRGPGVPETFVPRLFEAYSRACEHLEHGKPGSGLGLAIARGLAEAGKGEVWHERGRPRGACFCLRLPKPERA
jgi:PAS domain S-box-containing protein